MKQQERIRLLLSMQEHPENYTDEQLSQMLAADPELAELVEQLAMTKRALVKQEAEKEMVPMDDLWEQFVTEHVEELDALEEGDTNHPAIGSKSGKTLFSSKWQSRVAAFFGVILAAGVTFAAIQIVRMASAPKRQTSQTEQPLSSIPAKDVQKDTIRKDSTIKATPNVALKPIVFDNVPLDDMLSKIAAYYQTEVSFQKEEARQLRFFFVWKPEDGLEHAIEKLNRFESLSLRMERNKIIVE